MHVSLQVQRAIPGSEPTSALIRSCCEGHREQFRAEVEEAFRSAPTSSQSELGALRPNVQEPGLPEGVACYWVDSPSVQWGKKLVPVSEQQELDTHNSQVFEQRYQRRRHHGDLVHEKPP